MEAPVVEGGTQAVQAGIKLFGKTIALPQQATIKLHGGGGRDAVENGRSTTSPDDSSSSSTTTTTTTDIPQQVIKRPDKIIPCPRCKSMETKFCYFNNYNVNQPRHFCKGCQRYWTAGGALRNVPVGAGRRKAKPQPVSRSGHPVAAGGFSADEYCIFDASGVISNFDLDRMVLEDWPNHHHHYQQQQPQLPMMAARGGLCEDFPVKRRKEERI